ncbi:MAG: hypothetical protein M8354_13805, partial [Halalkalicoccus sp.]|nr:hypothetical protein [Halalkalicoccus sp.]
MTRSGLNVRPQGFTVIYYVKGQSDSLSKENQSMINISIVIEWLKIVLDWLNANSAAVTSTAGVLSAIATGGLVWLYRQQKNIQERLVEAE